MKRITRMNKAAWAVLALPLFATLTVFQNCSKVNFQTATDPTTKSVDKPVMYSNMTVGSANTPPLKLIFVVDNSYTMHANQISLASAFGSMFSGDNANSLSAFDSTAYVTTTAQASLAPNDPSYSLLPTLTPDQMNVMNVSDLASLRGGVSAQVSGKFSGDLVSYAATKNADPITHLNTYSYVPVPVLGLNSTGSASPISLGVHKDKAGSVSDFAAGFGERISYISPLRSQYDAAGHGVLDPVIDHESGLCALARVLKNNSNFLNKGDLAAFVIVSDEDDNDPAGSACIDAYQDQANADLVDAHCETPQTKLTYHAANSTAATCSYSYQKGFTYTSSYPTKNVTVKFDDEQYVLTHAATAVSFTTATYKYNQYKYAISSYSASQSYNVPMVNVSWSTVAKTCKTRDGVQVSCDSVYTAHSQSTKGTLAGSTCSVFASAVGASAPDNAHPVSCAQGTDVAASGACSTTDTSIKNCVTTYTKLADVPVYNDSATASCSALYAGKLASNAVLSGAPANYLPSCATPVASLVSSVAGTCPTDGSKASCAPNTPTTSSKRVAVAFTGAACSADAIKAAGLASNQTATTCSDATYVDAAVVGLCPSSLAAGVSCVLSATNKTGDSKTFAAAGCSDATTIAKNLPAYGVSPVTSCTESSTPSTADVVVTYSATVQPGSLVVKAGDACPSNIAAASAVAHPGQTACVVKSTVDMPVTAQGTCASNATSIASTCSNAANHCSGTPVDNQSSVNQPYQTATTSRVVPGTITCDMKCSSANGACGTGNDSKLVSDVYNGCVASDGGVATTNQSTGLMASMKGSLCAAPAQYKEDKAPYHTTSLSAQYVAGSASSKADPNALINYIKARSTELLGSELPSTSVFVRQKDGGQGGTQGKSYQAFASSMGGSNNDVSSSASVYASSLQSLSSVIKEKLSRSLSIAGFTQDQVVTRVWMQVQGSNDWVEKQEGVDWTANGGTILLSPALDMHTGDTFRAEYQ